MILRLKLIFIAITCLVFFTLYFVPNNLYAHDDNSGQIKASHKTLRQELLGLEKKADKVSNIFKKVYQLVGPSVVKIKMKSKRNIAGNSNNGSKLAHANQSEEESNPHNEKEFNLYKTFKLPDRDVGSGFIIDRTGLIVTNYHVVKDFDEKRIEVTSSDNKKYIGKIIGFDPGTDLALIKIEGGLFQPVIFSDYTITDVGDLVVAIGNPYGHGQTISTGVISAVGWRHTGPIPTVLSYEDFMQTDAAINPGCSGGPLVNMRGEVIGINAAIATRRGGFQGIGFAIPASVIREIIDGLIKDQKIMEPLRNN